MITSLADITSLLSVHGSVFVYSLIFLCMFFEGPTIIYLCSFAASLGYLNIGIILLLGILGGIIPDLLLYGIGRSLRTHRIEKIGAYFGLHKKKIAWLEMNIKKNAIKSIFIIKLVPSLPIPGLLLCGFMRMDFKKFFLTQLSINILAPVIFALAGFYSGRLVDTILHYFRFSELLIVVFVVLIIAFYYLSIYAKGFVSRKLRSH